MKKIKTTGSLNLEMALLIALLALAVIFGLTWMGGGIATTFNNAADFLLGSGSGSGNGTDPAWVGTPLEVTGGVDITTGVLEQDDAGDIEAVYVDNGAARDGSDGTYKHVVRVMDYTGAGIDNKIQLASMTMVPLSVETALYAKDNTIAGLSGEWVLVGDFIDEIIVNPTINGTYYQVRDGATIVGTVFMTDITGMEFDYLTQQFVRYNDVGLDNLVMIAPSSIETLDGVNHGITNAGAVDWDDGCNNHAVGFGSKCSDYDGMGGVIANNLDSVIYEIGLTTINAQSDWSDDDSSITAAYIPSTVTNLNGAFENWVSLVSIIVPDSVTAIENGAFWSCSGLTSVTIGNGVTSIGNEAFGKCSSLSSITIPDGVTSIGYEAFGGCSGLTSVTIGNGVTSIGSYAFIECSGLSSITIPDSVTSIEYGAFNKCYGLTSITIPDSVTSIGGGAFAYCTSLTSITIPNSVTSIGGGAFAGCSSLSSITIPNSVTSIGDSAFSFCSGLTSITIPNSVTSIGGYAFEYCSGLTSVTIPNSVTSIGDFAFGYCPGLSSVTIGNSVTSIGEQAFYYCSGLTSVTIGNGVTSIGYGAFQVCTSLTSITIDNTLNAIPGSPWLAPNGVGIVTWLR